MNAGSGRNTMWMIHAGGVVCCLLLTAGAYLTAIQPVLDAQMESRAQRIQLAEQQRIATDLDRTLGQLHRQMTLVNAELEQSQLQLESAGRINQRIAELTEIANDAGLRIQQIDPGRKHSDHLFDVVPIELGGKATYRNYLLFLRQLHSRFADIAVAEFQVVGAPESPTDEATFKLRLCWFTARETVATGQ